MADPVPAILEYLPYRKRDLTALNNEPCIATSPATATPAFGSTCAARANPTGSLTTSTLHQELEDGEAAIAWLAEQPWCTGNVGMIGNSWGGFNGLQIAALRPPALKAIVTSCSTDDRYADDMHYMGGCLLTDTLDWGAIFQALLALPPDPPLVGDRWREMWQAASTRSTYHGRGLAAPPAPRRVLEARLGQRGLRRHRVPGPRRRRLARRLLERDPAAAREAVRAAPCGSSGHGRTRIPHLGPRARASTSCPRRSAGSTTGSRAPTPGPCDEPMLRAWMQRGVPAQPFYDDCPGPLGRRERVAVARGSSDAAAVLGDGRSSATSRVYWLAVQWAVAAAHRHRRRRMVPVRHGRSGPEVPRRPARGRRPVADVRFGAPLPKRLEILGAPVVELDAFGRPPDGVRRRPAVRRCARRRVGPRELRGPQPHPPPVARGPRADGARRAQKVRVQLNDTAWAFQPGPSDPRRRSTTYWPMVWPSPEPVTVTVHAGSSTLDLPVRPARSRMPCWRTSASRPGVHRRRSPSCAPGTGVARSTTTPEVARRR